MRILSCFRFPPGMVACLLAVAGMAGADGEGAVVDDPAAKPGTLEELPAGRLKERLSELPPESAGRALRQLRELGIPTQDYELLRVDEQGNLFYSEGGLLPAEQ